MRHATVFRRKDRYLVHSSSRTTDGVWIGCEPYVAVPMGDDSALERAIHAALDASRVNVVHPRDQREWDRSLGPLLALAEVSSWRVFSDGAACVVVEDDGSRVVVIPTRNLGPKGGFEHDPSRQIVADRRARDALAVAARTLLA